MNRLYNALIGWWLQPIQEMFAEVSGYYQARNASELERQLRGLGLTDERLDDIRAGALLIAQSGYSAEDLARALIAYGKLGSVE